MRRLKRLAACSDGERRLLVRAFFVVGVTRLALWVLPLAIARRVVARTPCIIGSMPVERLVWAVTVASRYVPQATCLTRALAVQVLLARAGHEARIEIGVAKEAGQRFQAHAWVVCNNHIVIGGPEVARYARLTAWELISPEDPAMPRASR